MPEDVETCCEDIRDDVLQQCPQQQMQRGSQQERLPGLPCSLQKLQLVFLHGIKNLSAGSRVDETGYRWVYACLAVLVWRQVLQANLQLAAEEAVWDSFASKMVSMALAGLQLYSLVAQLLQCMPMILRPTDLVV